MKDSYLILFDSNKIKLKDIDTITVQKNETLNFYLIKSNIQQYKRKGNSDNINENKKINELIMSCTEAKNKLNEKLKYRSEEEKRENIMPLGRFEFFTKK